MALASVFAGVLPSRMMLCDCGPTLGTIPCWHLVVLAVSIGVTWAFTLQLLLNTTLFPAIAAAFSRRAGKSVDRAKLIQQLSEFVTYSSMLASGLWIVPFTPCMSDASACWEPEYSTSVTISEGLLVVYMFQLGGYVQMVVTERLIGFAQTARGPPIHSRRTAPPRATYRPTPSRPRAQTARARILTACAAADPAGSTGGSSHGSSTR